VWGLRKKFFSSILTHEGIEWERKRKNLFLEDPERPKSEFA
jgi:hypothetical protein